MPWANYSLLGLLWLIGGSLELLFGLLVGPGLMVGGTVLVVAAFVAFAVHDRKNPVRPFPPVDQELELVVSFDKPWYDAVR